MLAQHARFIPADPAGEAPTCNLGYIRRALGRAGYGDYRMVTYVRALIADYAFPRPLPTLRKKALTTDVTPDSNWLRPAVDAWLDSFLPPEAGAALTREAHIAAAAEMDEAAGALRIVGGTDR